MQNCSSTCQRGCYGKLLAGVYVLCDSETLDSNHKRVFLTVTVATVD